MTRDVGRTGTFLLLRKIGIICWVRQIKCLEPRRRKRARLGSMLCQFRRLGHYWTLRALGLPCITLRVGADVCIPNSCRCCGKMDSRGLHGLSCKYSVGRFTRNSAMNDVIKRALQNAGLPSDLETPEWDRGDQSRPDYMTIFPFSGNRSLVWDFTCADTFAVVHLIRSAMKAGIAEYSAEQFAVGWSRAPPIPLTFFVKEFSLPWEILLSLF